MIIKSFLTGLKKILTAHRNKDIGNYMDRWYIIPPEWKLPFSVRLHHIKLADVRNHHTHPYGQYTGRVTPELWDGRLGVINRISEDKYIRCMELMQLYFHKNTAFSEKVTKPQARLAFEMIELYKKQRYLMQLLLKENGGERKIIGDSYSRLRELVNQTREPTGKVKIFISHCADLRK